MDTGQGNIQKSLLTSAILWFWLVLLSRFTTSMSKTDFTKTRFCSLSVWHWSYRSLSWFLICTSELVWRCSLVPENLKENILERHCLSCRDWLRLFPFASRIVILLYNFEVEFRNQHCRAAGVKGRQGWAQIILEWKKNKIIELIHSFQEESEQGEIISFSLHDAHQQKWKVQYIRTTVACLAWNFKEKEMTAEDTAGNVQFAKTVWRWKTRKNTEMGLLSWETNSYP